MEVLEEDLEADSATEEVLEEDSVDLDKETKTKKEELDQTISTMRYNL